MVGVLEEGAPPRCAATAIGRVTGDTVVVCVKHASHVNTAFIRKLAAFEFERVTSVVGSACAIKGIILVTKGTPSHQARAEALAKHIETFTVNTLQQSVLCHKDVPLHTPLARDWPEAKALIGTKHRLELPKISTHDPPVRWLGLTPGTIVKITRCSRLQPMESEYIRMVIAEDKMREHMRHISFHLTQENATPTSCHF